MYIPFGGRELFFITCTEIYIIKHDVLIVFYKRLDRGSDINCITNIPDCILDQP